MPDTCPRSTIWDLGDHRVRLRCVLAAGHEGDCGAAEIEVDLTDLPTDLKHDYDYAYPDDQTEWDGEVIQRHLNESLEHHYMKHTMGK